jgi:mono/diheme cytochrome c family protein
VIGFKGLFLTAAVVSLYLGADRVAKATDVRHGADLAKRWCAGCHLVEPGQTGPTTEASPFRAVAKRSGFNAGKLAFFLLDPHPKMPNMQLTRNEAADIAAYIATLK